jgi:hypothetical protein
MSRHHMLPPIVYVPQPKPKKIENRKRRIQSRAAGTVGKMGDVAETFESIEAGQSTLTGSAPPPENFPSIEGSEKKPQPYRGLLSENTLKVMLLAQELKQP